MKGPLSGFSRNRLASARSAIGTERSDRSRTLRRIVALGVGAGVTAASGLVLATPSSAADLGTYSVDCANTVFTSPNSLQASVGDTITVSNTGLVDCVVTTQDVAVSGGTTTLSPRQSVTLTFTTVGVAVALVTDDYPSYSKGIGFVALVTGSPGSSGPTPVLQQFGMPTTGTCDSAQPDGLNIGGVESGGWGDSWAQWMNEGTGGFICTRTLTYSNSLGHWVVD